MRSGPSPHGAGALYGATVSAEERAIECFVTGAETTGTLDPAEARYGKENLVPLRSCTDPRTGRTYTNVLTVLTR